MLQENNFVVVVVSQPTNQIISIFSEYFRFLYISPRFPNIIYILTNFAGCQMWYLNFAKDQNFHSLPA